MGLTSNSRESPERRSVTRRRERAQSIVGFDRRTADRLSLEAANETDELAIRVPDVERAYSEDTDTELTAQQARLLSQTRSRAEDDDRTGRVASVARKHAAAGLAPSAYVGSFVPLFEELVTEALARTVADTEELRTELLAGIRSAMVDMQVGVDEFADADVEPLAPDEYGEELTLKQLFDSIPHPSYPSTTTTQCWRTTSARTGCWASKTATGSSWAGTVGTRSRRPPTRTAAATTRSWTRSPRTRVTPTRSGTSSASIRTTSTPTTSSTRIRASRPTPRARRPTSSSSPHIFADGGSLKAVFELTRDWTDEAHYQQSVSAMVDEVNETLAAIGDGGLSARVGFEDEYGALERELLEMTGEIDEIAENFQDLITRVSKKTTDIQASIERATTSARDIDGMIHSQRESLEQVANEMEEFSAMMEEVVTTSNEVAEAAETALSEAERGV